MEQDSRAEGLAVLSAFGGCPSAGGAVAAGPAQGRAVILGLELLQVMKQSWIHLRELFHCVVPCPEVLQPGKYSLKSHSLKLTNSGYSLAGLEVS